MTVPMHQTTITPVFSQSTGVIDGTNTPWLDNLQYNAVGVSAIVIFSGGTATLTIEESDDTTNVRPVTSNVNGVSPPQVVLYGTIRRRYWRVRYNTAGGTATLFTVDALTIVAPPMDADGALLSVIHTPTTASKAAGNVTSTTISTSQALDVNVANSPSVTATIASQPIHVNIDTPFATGHPIGTVTSTGLAGNTQALDVNVANTSPIGVNVNNAPNVTVSGTVTVSNNPLNVNPNAVTKRTYVSTIVGESATAGPKQILSLWNGTTGTATTVRVMRVWVSVETVTTSAGIIRFWLDRLSGTPSGGVTVYTSATDAGDSGSKHSDIFGVNTTGTVATDGIYMYPAGSAFCLSPAEDCTGELARFGQPLVVYDWKVTAGLKPILVTGGTGLALTMNSNPVGAVVSLSAWMEFSEE